MSSAPQTSPVHSLELESFYRLIIPREHGSWGLWVLPLVSGATVGLFSIRPAGALHIETVAWFFVASTCAFLAHQPLEEILGRSLMKIRNGRERRLAWYWTAGCLSLAALAVGRIVREGYPLVLFFAFVAVNLFVLRLVMGHGRELRTTSQVIGAIGLTLTAPGAYYVVTDQIDATTFLLWAASWLFAAAQIVYVHMRIRNANASSLREKARAGWKVCLLEISLPVLALLAASFGQIALLGLAFVPGAFRCLFWAATRPQRLRVHRLGVSELIQSLVFNALLTATIVISR